ncbi:SMR family transporter [uncultured Enterovirga sp.]|uniref:SMR family transporter n=1 Tax=uncultured Enterovirga sp. TaxID=2026352 RepID=UPI0035CBA9ED
MSPTSLLALAVAILAEVAATTALKASDGLTRLWPTIATIVGYALAFWMMSLAMRSVPVGVIYAIWSGVGIVLISLVGWLAFGERLDGPALAGIGLIVAGVLVINLLSGSVRH